MTSEEWLAWAGESTQSEWVDGEASVLMPPTTVHALVSIFLARLIAGFVDLFDLGVVIDAPFEMRLERSAREPDILFIATAHRDRLTAERLVGPADLVVEQISDDSATRDRRDKLAECAAAGIPEYWLLDHRPGRERATLYRLSAHRTYEAIPLDADGRYHSAIVPGFWLDPTWLWRDPLPNPEAPLALIASSGS